MPFARGSGEDGMGAPSVPLGSGKLPVPRGGLCCAFREVWLAPDCGRGGNVGLRGPPACAAAAVAAAEASSSRAGPPRVAASTTVGPGVAGLVGSLFFGLCGDGDRPPGDKRRPRFSGELANAPAPLGANELGVLGPTSSLVAKSSAGSG